MLNFYSYSTPHGSPVGAPQNFCSKPRKEQQRTREVPSSWAERSERFVVQVCQCIWRAGRQWTYQKHSNKVTVVQIIVSEYMLYISLHHITCSHLLCTCTTWATTCRACKICNSLTTTISSSMVFTSPLGHPWPLESSLEPIRFVVDWCSRGCIAGRTAAPSQRSGHWTWTRQLRHPTGVGS